MNGFWFGVIVGAFITAFIHSIVREDGWARRSVNWLVGWVKSLGVKTS